MAHNHWEQLMLLIKCVDHPQNDIYIHIDKNVDKYPKQEIEKTAIHSKLIWVKRFRTEWGSPKTVSCILNLLASASSGHYDYYHLLSGMDLPLASQNDIHAFFASHTGKQFVGFDWEGIEKDRFLYRIKYFYPFSAFLGKKPYNTSTKKMIGKIQDLIILFQSKLNVNRIGKTKLYKGSVWFSITDELVAGILREKKKIEKEYAFTLCADELWLQNYIMYSGWSKMLANDNARYIRWIQGDPSPQVLTMDDYPAMLQAGKMFARKFDDNIDKVVIDAIYQIASSNEVKIINNGKREAFSV